MVKQESFSLCLPKIENTLNKAEATCWCILGWKGRWLSDFRSAVRRLRFQQDVTFLVTASTVLLTNKHPVTNTEPLLSQDQQRTEGPQLGETEQAHIS